MFEFVLAIVAFAGAMSVPAFFTAMVESATSRIRLASVRAHLGDRKFAVPAPQKHARAS